MTNKYKWLLVVSGVMLGLLISLFLTGVNTLVLWAWLGAWVTWLVLYLMIGRELYKRPPQNLKKSDK